MFARLTGKVELAGPSSAVVDVNGVGYLVHCSARTLSQLQARGEVTLHIETQVREDAIVLYGFLSRQEQDWFRLLNTVQGVGGKAALSILSVLAPEEIGDAIAAHDAKMVSRADGIGPKLAERICNELKGKVGALDSGKTGPAMAAVSGGGSSPGQDAVSALVNLGFARAEAYRVVQSQLQSVSENANENISVGQLIQQGLKELSAS